MIIQQEGFWWGVLLGFIIGMAILWLCYKSLKDKNSDKCEINGVILGDNFKLICEMEDEDIKLFVDVSTKVLYLATQEGITPLLDEKGKPTKYNTLEDTLKRR